MDFGVGLAVTVVVTVSVNEIVVVLVAVAYAVVVTNDVLVTTVTFSLPYDGDNPSSKNIEVNIGVRSENLHQVMKLRQPHII